MRIGERKLSNNNLEIVVIPRDEGDIVFKFKPVLDETRFNEASPQPKPPLQTGENGKTYLYEHPDYIKAVSDYIEIKQAWMFLESISATIQEGSFNSSSSCPSVHPLYPI